MVCSKPQARSSCSDLSWKSTSGDWDVKPRVLEDHFQIEGADNTMVGGGGVKGEGFSSILVCSWINVEKEQVKQ